MNQTKMNTTFTNRLKYLNKYTNLFNIEKIKKLGFENFSKFIRNKCILDNFRNFFSTVFDLEDVKDSNKLVRKFLTSYVIVCFPDVIFSNEFKDVDDLQLQILSNKVSNLFNNILNCSDDSNELDSNDSKMQEFKIELKKFVIFFDNWTKKDLIKVLLPFANSYYELNDTLANVTKNQTETITDDIKIWKSEIEKQKAKILNHVKHIDGNDAVTFVKNYKPPKLVIDEKVYEQIEKTMKKAYWDKLKEDIENNDFSMITSLLKDVRDMIFNIIPNRQDLRNEFEGKIDFELVEQMITYKAMSVKTVYDICLTFISYLKMLQAPIDDKKNEEWCENITSLFHTENLKYSEILPAFFSGMFERLEKIQKQLHEFHHSSIKEKTSKN